MIIIEIHVDTIENAETSPSTQPKREDERSAKANHNLLTTGTRLWDAIKMSFPGSLLLNNKTRDE